jgi:hypothetical protein
MQLQLLKNNDNVSIVAHKVARAIYAETYGAHLPAIEALASMVTNICLHTKRDLSDIVDDPMIFESANKNSARYKDRLADAARPQFQICLRAAKRMMNGQIPDIVMGAKRFHRAEDLPEWATSVGYVAEVGDLFFYK